jgi:hypothetical protein
MDSKQTPEVKMKKVEEAILGLLQYMLWMTYLGLYECDSTTPKYMIRPALRSLEKGRKITRIQCPDAPRTTAWKLTSTPMSHIQPSRMKSGAKAMMPTQP